MILMSALALALAGSVAYFLQSRLVDQQIDDHLTANISVINQIAEAKRNPVTGEVLTDPDDVVRAALQVISASSNEGIVGFRASGRPLVAGLISNLDLSADTEFMDKALSFTGQPEAHLATIKTATADYRTLIVPVGSSTTANTTASSSHPALVIAIDREAEHAPFTEVYTRYALIAAGSLLVVGVIAWLFAGQLLKPIRQLTKAAQRSTETDLSQRIPVRGRDDVAAMAVQFNAMLDRLQQAFDANHQLLDDVGHELRTPITVVRGNLELMDSDDPVDVTNTRELALDELDRMNLLVTDLLTLADAASPNFCNPKPEDFSQVVAEIYNKARGITSHNWKLSNCPPTAVSLDKNRITQAVIQLAANAAKYSEHGTEITIGGKVEPGLATIWVQDHGIGIATQKQKQIFERFNRGGLADSRYEGSGLGLAIVSAIASGHSGVVGLESAPGLGSIFSIKIPVTTEESQ